MAQSCYTFGSYRLDHHGRVVWRDEEVVPLTGTEFRILSALVTATGEPVSKEFLLKTVWPDQPNIEENNLAQHIRKLRTKLGRTEAGETYIRNFTNVGYFLSVSVIHAAENGANTRSTPAAGLPVAPPRQDHDPTIQKGTPTVRWALIAGAVFVVLALALSFPIYRRRREEKPTPSSVSVAVLDFRASPTGKKISFSAAIVTEWIRTELAGARSLRTIPGEEIAQIYSTIPLPDSLTLAKATLSRIRQMLNSDYVVLGSVAQVQDGAADIRIDVTVQDSRTGEVVDAESVAGSKESLLDLVARLGSKLRTKLGSDSILPAAQIASLRESLPANDEAAQLYISGLASLRAFDPLTANKLLIQASVKDPRSAAIRSALAETWKTLGYEQKAKVEASKALELSGKLPRDEQLLEEARYAELARDWPRAISAYSAIWEYSPDELEKGLRLANAQIAAGRENDGLATLAALRKISPPNGNYPRFDLEEAEADERLGNFAGEAKAARKAISTGQRRGNRLLVARAQLKLGWALDYLGQRTEAEEVARTAEQSFLSLGDIGDQARAVKNIADVLDDGGHHKEALPAYLRALALFRQIGSRSGEAVALMNMAFAVKALGDLKKSADLFTQSAAVSKESGDSSREGQALHGKASLLWRQGKLAEAEASYNAALACYGSTGEERRMAVILGDLALVIQDEGRLPEAQSRLEASLRLLKAQGDQSNIARTLGNLGFVNLFQGHVVAARSDFEDQLTIGQRIGEDKQCAYAHQGLAEVSFELNDMARARESASAALKLREKAGEADLALESKLFLAKLNRNRRDAVAIGRSFQANERLDEAAEAEGVAIEAASSLDPPDLNAAEESAQALKPLLGKIEDHSIRISVFTALAENDCVSGHMGAGASKLRSLARSAAEQGYRIAELEARLLLAKTEPNAEGAKIREDAERTARALGLARLAAEATVPKHRYLQVAHIDR